MQISRDIMTQLAAWKTSPRRKPLLLRGMRQCGKSWVLDEFGSRSFQNTVHLNFDKDTALHDIFETNYDPSRILQELRAYKGVRILPQETLLVFDEIQACPRALNSLKYFCEDASEYAIAAAGSLLGVKLAKGIGFPVGKVDMLDLHPCSFKEYLRAVDESVADYIGTIPLEPLNRAFTTRLEGYFREYLAWGGLPEVLSTYIDTKDFVRTEAVIEDIVRAYEGDFGKYAEPRDVAKIQLIWDALPNQFAKDNRKFIYGEVKAGARARELEDALMWLINADLVKKVMCASVPELPLLATADRKTFKLYSSDVGLLRHLAKLAPEKVFLNKDVFSNFRGHLVENYVLQQLETLRFDPVCYWYNQSGEAEVDFLVQTDFDVVPIEVKSGTCLNAKSLRTFREKFKPKLAIRASLQNLCLDNGLLNIPLYLLSELPRFLKEIRGWNEI